MLTIKHINAAQLVPILRPLVAQQGHLAAYPTTNVLIISDRASNISRIDRIIAEMDKEIDSDIEIIKLNHAFAAEVVRLLSSLNVTSPDQKQAPVETTGNTHVVYLRYADAVNIAGILSNVGKEAAKAEAKNVGASGGGSGGQGESVSVQADEDSNALVITAPASIFPSLRAVIQQLDIPRAQVHIEAIIAEVSLDTSNELGVQWIFNNQSDGPVGAVRFSDDDASFEGLVNGIIPNGATLGLGALDDDGLSIATIIRALQGDAETNLLSTPSIVTLDNQEAEIIVGQNVPFVTGESTSSTSDTTNPFRTVDIITNKRSIRTTVQLEDGALLILGGLIDETVIDTEQKVPFLGDIPIIGALFRSSRVSKVKQNLLVFIRSTIIKDPDKARLLSLQKYNFIRDLQIESNDSSDDILGPVLVPYE